MRNLICVMLVVLLPLTLASQTQKRFKVAVFVAQGDDVHITNTLESHLKRELRLLGDVDIVEFDEFWHFTLYVNFFEIEFKDGSKTGYVALASVFYQKIPYTYFKVDRLADLLRESVYIQAPNPAYYHRDNLDKYCVGTVGDIDKNHLAPIRRSLR